MNKLGWFFTGLAVIVALGIWAVLKQPVPTQTNTPTDQQDQTDLGIQIDSPVQNATVGSPLTVTGQAKGNWYFEAQFPVELRDANNNVVASGAAHAQGDWMTENFVPFTTTLTWTATPATTTGYLYFKPDDPSGGANPNLPTLNWPVTF